MNRLSAQIFRKGYDVERNRKIFREGMKEVRGPSRNAAFKKAESMGSKGAPLNVLHQRVEFWLTRGIDLWDAIDGSIIMLLGATSTAVSFENFHEFVGSSYPPSRESLL